MRTAAFLDPEPNWLGKDRVRRPPPNDSLIHAGALRRARHTARTASSNAANVTVVAIVESMPLEKHVFDST
jgi:hypothetical protein